MDSTRRGIAHPAVCCPSGAVHWLVAACVLRPGHPGSLCAERVTRSASRQCGAAGRWQASSIAAGCKPVLMPQLGSALSWLKTPCHPTVCWHLRDKDWSAAAVCLLTSRQPAVLAASPHRHAMWRAAACSGQQWYAAGISDPKPRAQSCWLRDACHALYLSSWPSCMIQFLWHTAHRLPLPGKSAQQARLAFFRPLSSAHCL